MTDIGNSILQGLNVFISNFGSIIVIPIMLFIISLAFGISLKKAFTSSLYAGIGLTGFSWLVSQYLPIIIPVVNNMVAETGIHLPIVDVGWQATALVAYATQAGMIYLAVGLAFQLFIFIIGWTNVFQPSGLWDNYGYMMWGSLVFVATQNMWLALFFMITLNLWATTGYEILAKRWSKYYNYPNCTIVQMHHMDIVPFALLSNWVMNRLGANKIRWQPEELRIRLGFIGDPIPLGFILGFMLGFFGNITRLNTIAGWASIALAAMATSTVMAVFPRVAALFAQAFTHLAVASRRFAKNTGRDEIYVGVDDAAGYGEPATLISGIILIPIMVFLAAILPGNKMLPLVDLIALPFMVEVFVAFSNGNIFKAVVGGALWFSLGLIGATTLAPLFTSVYSQYAPQAVEAGGMVSSFGIMAKPIWVLFTQASIYGGWIAVGVLFLAYWPVTFWWHRNRKKVQDYIEREAGLDVIASEETEEEEVEVKPQPAPTH